MTSLSVFTLSCYHIISQGPDHVCVKLRVRGKVQVGAGTGTGLVR